MFLVIFCGGNHAKISYSSNIPDVHAGGSRCCRSSSSPSKADNQGLGFQTRLEAAAIATGFTSPYGFLCVASATETRLHYALQALLDKLVHQRYLDASIASRIPSMRGPAWVFGAYRLSS